jgi:antagonist of KipI
MDEFALRAANLLVGNDQGAAGLEMAVLGPGVRFLSDTWIALTGAELSARLDGKPLQRWRNVEAHDGSVLSFHGMQDGMRAYLAVAGGIDVPLVMGSRSTYVKAAIGGVEGRALIKGDVISTLATAKEAIFVPRRLPEEFETPIYGEHHEIRVILGPQQQAFTPEAISTLWGSSYVISLESDRMGYKLEGPPLEHRTGPDIVSDGNPPGAIQVPGEGIPTILLADRGTTGGYTKIATVISIDVGRLAQAVPGNSVSFRPVTLEEARLALRQQEAVLSAIAARGHMAHVPSTTLSISVDGEAYEVVDEDGNVIAQPHVTGSQTSARGHRATATVDGHAFEFEVEVRREE